MVYGPDAAGNGSVQGFGGFSGATRGAAFTIGRLVPGAWLKGHGLWCVCCWVDAAGKAKGRGLWGADRITAHKTRPFVRAKTSLDVTAKACQRSCFMGAPSPGVLPACRWPSVSGPVPPSHPGHQFRGYAERPSASCEPRRHGLWALVRLEFADGAPPARLGRGCSGLLFGRNKALRERMRARKT